MHDTCVWLTHMSSGVFKVLALNTRVIPLLLLAFKATTLPCSATATNESYGGALCHQKALWVF